MRRIVPLIAIFATLAACTPLAQGQIVTNNDQLEINTVYFSTRSEDSGVATGFKRSGPVIFTGDLSTQAGLVPVMLEELVGYGMIRQTIIYCLDGEQMEHQH